MPENPTLDLVGLAKHSAEYAELGARLHVDGNTRLTLNDKDYALVDGKPVDIEAYLADANARRDHGRLVDLEPGTPTHYCKTLQAVADYVALAGEGCWISADEDSVRVLSVNPRHDGMRSVLLASTVPDCPFDFGKWYSPEDFVPLVITGFADPCLEEESFREKQRLLDLFRDGLQTILAVSTQGDGVSQTVKVERRTGLVDNVPLDNRFTLRPYRTFREVSQPEGIFTLQLDRRGDEMVARLNAVDAEAWKLQAISSIKDFLVEAGVTVPVVG